MAKKERDSKRTQRLQLRREVIRILADDSLAKVGGGWGGGDTSCQSACYPSKLAG